MAVNANLRRHRGIVIAYAYIADPNVSCRTSKNLNGASSIVYAGYGCPLYVLPTKLFDIAHLKAQGFSKSQVNKRSSELYFGDSITFKAEGNQIIAFDRDYRGDEYYIVGEDIFDYSTVENFPYVEKDSQNKFAIKAEGILSDEEVRRFYCPTWRTTDPFPIPNEELEKVLPNVAYELYVVANVNLNGYKPYMDSTLCDPTYTLSFGDWIRPLAHKANTIGNAPWNYLRRNNIRNVSPRYIVRATELRPTLHCTCLLLNKRELFCFHYPDEKFILGLINDEDVSLTEGCLLYCKMFYSYHNKAYIVHWYEHRKTVRIGIEHPPRIRLTENGEKQFLVYVSSNTYGPFFHSATIPMISDPNNILHGNIKIGIEDVDEKEGVPAWIRYTETRSNPKNPARFEVVQLAEKKYRVNGKGEKISVKKSHKTFTSKGFLLNKRGTVYCPHLSNFPIVLVGVKKESFAANFVGAKIEFKAKFSKERKVYEVNVDSLTVIQKQPYDLVMLANEQDEYAIRLPLRSNGHYTVNMLTNFQNAQLGFVEVLSKEMAAFMRMVDRIETDNAIYVPIWCRENPNLEQRITPLVCMSVEQPEGTFIRAIANAKQ